MSRSKIPKEVEEFPRRLKSFVWIIILLILFGTISFRLISEKTFKDAFIRTFQTLAVMFHPDSTTPERILEIFLALVGVFLIWWVLWSFADMVLEGSLKKYLKTRFYSAKMESMKNHIIIVGGGRVGEEIAQNLAKKKKDFIIIESDPKATACLRKSKYVFIEGDALNEDVLKRAGIEKASKIILTLPKTEQNILITLTAKELNSKIEIHSRCESQSLVSKLKRAGAKVVIVPEIVAADTIADKLGI
ncbi:MAG TPA: NAD-binding protein [Candidatus Pacearchaeota archaeon]|nr:NAD-binding protein [Candidatus Pacearchaeota archaeon]